MNEKLLAVGAIVAAVVVMATIVFPFWNLIPSMVTETVHVVYVEAGKCTAETNDGYIIRDIPCNAKIGDNITATYDAKVKDREHKI
ncbi:conserved exported hypothetical protein [Nitrosotalea sinensis]|jgi:hypothetical protein|uniref:Uncharacterized protein n=1 Tax=Nitrosotalea sinensis TaxID=1499975 RepID=A0A2H1EI58_9ARCH|nr:hypothetical protein [Candidatus Nitrosotalea sinensis]SHO46304.1 conserved exported hypothetical protein [Candidatus Nitrosotalea sinensis]